MEKRLGIVIEEVVVLSPKGPNESKHDFHFRQTFQQFCSRPVMPRSRHEESGDFINRVLLSRDKNVKH